MARKRRFSCVYVLFSLVTGEVYVGQTENVRRRLREHHEGQCPSTAPLRPFVVVLMEFFLTRTDSLRREAYLKTPPGQKHLTFALSESLAICRTKRSDLRRRMGS